MTRGDIWPKRGEIWWINSEPRTGDEIQKRRPALILSDSEFNSLGRMVAAVPISSGKGSIAYRHFRVATRDGMRIQGWAIVSQMRFLDWVAREGDPIEMAPDDFVEDVAAMAAAMLRLP